MPVPKLPDFEQTLAVAGDRLDAGELSECHGVLCGLLCHHPSSTADAFISRLVTLELISDPGEEFTARLIELFEATGAQLADEQLRLTLWLPADEELLEERTIALGHWCTGFIAGLGSGHDLSLDTLSEDVSEALSDLQQIAQAEVSDCNESEEDEAALVEIIEYIRIVTLMMREELSPPSPQDRLH
jgi:uncharacterized protein YgfB (UPF0149 family)